MSRQILWRHLSFSVTLFLLYFSLTFAHAATIRLDTLPLGKVISLNGQKFTKIRNDATHGSQFIALTKVNFLPTNTQPTANCPMNRIIGTMQTWNNCANLVKPTALNYTNIGCLVDERDGKVYEIRKFADGKCWMVDNLKYGGTIDACVNKTTFDGCGNNSVSSYGGCSTGASKSGSAWGYGDCRNNPSSTTYGYLYNWQAAMQHSSAYYGANYTGPNLNVQGICPVGWHLPTGGSAGEYQALHSTAGSPSTGFWQGGPLKGVLTGHCEGLGKLVNQEIQGSYWSSTQYNTRAANLAAFTDSVVYQANAGDKGGGLAVRCIKN